MKNIKKLIQFVFLIFFIIGCSDAIDIEQPGRLGAEEAFQTVADLQLGLFGAYDQFDTTPEIQFNAIFTDELSIGFDNGGQGLGDGSYGFILNPSSDSSIALWNNYYAALNAVSRVIGAADLVTPEVEEQADFKNILGQAYALRAYAHFQLISYLSVDYTDSSSLGTIILDFVPTIDQFLPRNTTGEVFTSILNDLDLADDLLTIASNPKLVSKDFITALRARIAAYRENYTAANNYATSLLAKYPLANRFEYVAMFDDANDTEVIFSLAREVNDNYDGQGITGSGFAGGWAGANFAFISSVLDGSPYFEMGRTLFNLMDPDDIRFTVSVDETSIIDPDYLVNKDPALDILVISKYPGKNGRPLMNNLKVFRVSEMLLIKAEALADANDLTGVATLIKQLRDARFRTTQTLPVYTNQTEAFAAILDERRIELAFEGHRYKDLKRLGTRAGKNVDRDAIDCAVNGACSLAVTDHRFTMPVPLVELDANPNVQQNPGY